MIDDLEVFKVGSNPSKERALENKIQQLHVEIAQRDNWQNGIPVQPPTMNYARAAGSPSPVPSAASTVSMPSTPDLHFMQNHMQSQLNYLMHMQQQHMMPSSPQ